MRSAGNFSSEWGYLAPAPSFVRTARIVVVATAIGATAGAGVVFSLIEHPAPEVSTSAVAAHAILTSAHAAPAPTAPPATVSATTAAVSAPASAQSPMQAPIAVAIPAPPKPHPVLATQSPQNPPPQISPLGSQSVGSATVTAPPAPSVAALSEGTPATAAAPADATDQSSVAPAEESPPKKPAAKHAGTGNPANAKNKPTPGLGTVLRQLFTAHAGTSYYPNR